MYRDENDLLSVIHRPLKFWLFIIILAYIMTYFGFSDTQGPFYEPNGQVFVGIKWFHIGGVVIALIIGLISGAATATVKWSQIKLISIIILSVILLTEIVFLTGGFLDSPFSGAVSLYIGIFIVMRRPTGLQLANTLIVLFTLLLLLLPYIFLSYYAYPSIHILRWKDAKYITSVRLLISVCLLIFTSIVGARVSRKVSKLPESAF